MPSTVNKRKFNHQKAHRLAARAKKLAKNPKITQTREDRKLVTPYTRKAVASNPNAPLRQSKKKTKRLEKLARISQRVNKQVHQPKNILDSHQMLL